MENLKKEITFIYTDNVEKSCFEPVAQEAQNRGYSVKFSSDQLEKCEIGFYISHLNYPKNSKFSVIMLHDLGQQHSHWPVIWKNEFWNHFDVGFLPSKEWEEMWHNASCYDFACPRQGAYYSCWAKADKLLSKDFSSECEEIAKKYNIDRSKKTLLYAPSWEWDGRQMDVVETAAKLGVNLIVKHFPWKNENACFAEQIRQIEELKKKCQGRPNLYLFDSDINIFSAIALCDGLISEESSTLFEAMLMEKPVVAVTDWLVPDGFPVAPPRKPDFPYDFALKVTSDKLEEAISKVLFDKDYLEKIISYKKENFAGLGTGSAAIMDVIDELCFGAVRKQQPIPVLPKKEAPEEFTKRVAKRRRVLFKHSLKLRFADHSKVMGALYRLYRKLK